jgi:hypothetical protein
MDPSHPSGTPGSGLDAFSTSTPTRVKPLARPASSSPADLRAHTENQDGMNNPLFQGTLSDPPLEFNTPLPATFRVGEFPSLPTASLGKGKRPLRPSIKRPKSDHAPSEASAGSHASSQSRVSFVDSSDLVASGEEPEPSRRLMEAEMSDDGSGSDFKDDDKDEDYKEPNSRRPRTPATQRSHVTGESPAKRQPSKSTVSPTTKMLVKKADPNGGACLLTNLRWPEEMLQCCHLLARRTKDELVSLRLTRFRL